MCEVRSEACITRVGPLRGTGDWPKTDAYTVKHLSYSGTIAELHRLLGRSAILLRCNGKCPTTTGWTKLTPEHMTPRYLGQLHGSNIGVALGGQSRGLCAIDLDDKSSVRPFLRANPK